MINGQFVWILLDERSIWLEKCNVIGVILAIPGGYKIPVGLFYSCVALTCLLPLKDTLSCHACV